MHPSKLTPDQDEIADRRPAACPACGATVAFGHLGQYPERLTLNRRGVTNEYDTTWQRFHCPECNAVFAYRTKANRVEQ